MTRDDKENIRW